MQTNFLKFTKMQISALSQIVWLQLLCIVLYPMFFNQINADNDTANIITYTAGLLMLSYLIIRNFAFNDAKYKTKLLFSILPITHGTIIGSPSGSLMCSVSELISDCVCGMSRGRQENDITSTSLCK